MPTLEMTKSDTNVVRIDKMVNPHFKSLWMTKCPYVIAKGGRGSFKSSTISIKLVMMMLKQINSGHVANIICLRKVSSYLKDSVYNQVVWALGMLNISNEFTYGTKPMIIRHRLTGSTFYFWGVSDPMRLKSNIVNNVIAIWYEELAEFDSQIDLDQTNPTFIRQKSANVSQVQVFYSYNPPRNAYEWVNEWVAKQANDPDYFVDTSTYLDDDLGFTTPQQLKLIESYKHNDNDYYRWLYLGEVIGLGTNVYNMSLFKPLNELPDDWSITSLFYSIDMGHQTSATTCGCFGLTQNGDEILLDTYYYSPAGKVIKKAPSDFSKDINDYVKRTSEKYKNITIRNRTIDSAEGGFRNQYYKDWGIRWHGVNKAMKKVNMIDYTQDLLAQGRFYYLDTPQNQIFIEQHQQYQWQEKTFESGDPKVIKENDHTCDMFQYQNMDNARLLRLKR